MQKGLIKIIGLKVSSYVGVPDKEREQRQDLLIDVTIKPSNSLQDLNDNIEDTVDYFLVAQKIKEIASIGERKLIETLAEEIIDSIRSFFVVDEVEVEVKKFILDDAKYVSVILKS